MSLAEGKRELELQAEIKASVIRQGGYSFKLSNQFTIGIPDLLIALPPFAPCLCEVKDLGPCPDNFQRQLNVTPKQRSNLNKMSAGYGGDTSFLLVGLSWGGARTLAILPKECERLTSDMLHGSTPFGRRYVGKQWDIRVLMARAGFIQEVPHVPTW